MVIERIDVRRTGFLGFSGYHWLVIAAAWAGWGFDVFDALLFNFVAPDCVPVLLGLQPGTPAAHEATVFWTGAITSILLVGWAAGGVLFGWLADRIGRKQALFATVALYAAGTALCAVATHIWQLIAFRVLSSLGIGGEWGIGAALVAETVPENRRVEAGVILQSSSPLGIVLASAVNYFIAGVWFAGSPQTSWRYVFLGGLAPVVLALLIRVFVRESAHWTASAARERPPSPRELFSADMRKLTISGAGVAVTAVISMGCLARSRFTFRSCFPRACGPQAPASATTSGVSLQPAAHCSLAGSPLAPAAPARFSAIPCFGSASFR